jgi:hypothetical protein
MGAERNAGRPGLALAAASIAIRAHEELEELAQLRIMPIVISTPSLAGDQ